MILTKEQQERMVANYVKNGATTDGMIGFIDGMSAMAELINEVNKEPKYGKHYSFNSK